jgi:hypothetical protein
MSNGMRYRGQEPGGRHADRASSRSPRRTRLGRGLVAATLLGAMGLAGGLGVTSASAAQVTGTMQAQGLTRPGGGAWLPGGGGHFWVSDSVLGLCQTVPASLSTTRCTGAAKGGQTLYDPAKNVVYVADATTKTNQVLRYPYTAATDSLGGAVALSVPNLTAIGGGTGGGRAQGLALVTGPDGTQRLYVAYLKSGDIMQVTNPSTATRTVTKIGNTTAGGANALTVFSWTDGAGVNHDDLYIAEAGGNGMSVIRDVDGTGGRPACGSGATPCNATTVTSAGGTPLFSFPGALASDGTELYIADAPRNTPSRVLRWNPVTGAQDVYSTGITPTYTSAFDGTQRSVYQNITGLAVNPATLDLYVGDDPSFPLATPVNAQGHLWKIAGNAVQPTVTSVTLADGSPATGDITGGTQIVVHGTNLVNAVAGAGDPTAFGSTVKFGATAGTALSCDSAGASCTVTSPPAAGPGVADVRVTNIEGQTSPIVVGDQFTYTAATGPAGSPVVKAVSPSTGLTQGGTAVKISGTGLINADGTPGAVSFGTTAATAVSCLPDGSQCTATSPAGTNGTTVDVQVTTTIGTSPAAKADAFTYVTPIGRLLSSGITAPKGGLTFIPNGAKNADGSPAGHYWVSDHGNGLCRLDAITGTTLLAPNVAVCDPGFTVGSPGQAVYDPRANPDGSHWVYVPDNAVKSPGVWRLTFDPATETISNPVGMAPGLLDNLKTNSLALDTATDTLYVGDLVDGNIRRIVGIGGDPRTQTVDIVAVTQVQGKVGGVATGRGINGTMALLDGKLYLPENNAATYIDVAACPTATGPCNTIPLDFLQTPAPVFVAGVAADPTNKFIYISESPGTANATIYRFDATTITAAKPGGSAAPVYVTAGRVPAAGTPEAVTYCTTTCTRPNDPGLTPGGTTGFPFAQGLYVDPNTAKLFVTEDASAGARSGRGHAWEVPFIP